MEIVEKSKSEKRGTGCQFLTQLPPIAENDNPNPVFPSTIVCYKQGIEEELRAIFTARILRRRKLHPHARHHTAHWTICC